MGKQAKQAKRRGNHAGRLELRGDKWLAVWMVNGKRKSQTTGETDREAAEKWLARKLEAVRTSDGLRQLDKDADTIREMQKTVLGARLAEIVRHGDEAERKATAARLAQAASELQKGATAKA